VSKSEVAATIASIAAEYHACTLGLEGVAIVARHEIITARMERLEVARIALVEQLGAEVAMPLIIEAIDKGGKP
jgi:hypothetical protein